ncbi:MAG: AAA family ATPase [Planctomycetes bacterium]|nr:AAA family ATPase [Planctomycetota bacterium]
MKVLAVRGCNLASLAGEFEVDLARPPLDRAGLYAITGPTGSGKTTLLDALCLALYDRTPRLSGSGGSPIGAEGSPEELRLRAQDARSVLRRGTGEAWAEVDFVGRDRRAYRARWQVRTARRRAGARLQSAEHSLRELGGGPSLGGTATETLAAIEERLGLSFDQFRRSALLAQGDFAAFLKADAGERSGLLEKVTGTAIYGRLSVAAHERAREEQRAVAALRDAAASQITLDEPSRLDLEAAREAARAARGAAEAERSRAAAAVEWHRARALLHSDVRSAESRLAEATAAWEGAGPRREELARVEAAQGLRPLLERADLADAAWEAARGSHDQARQGRAQAETVLRQRGEALAAALEERRRLLVAAAGEAARGLASAGAARAEAESRHRAAVRSLESALGELAAAEASVAPGTREGLARRRGVLQGRHDGAVAAAGASREAMRLVQAAGRSREEALAEGRAEGLEREEACRARSRSAQAWSRLASEREVLRQAEAVRDLEAHRAGLRPGEPCPLCGSPEHPWAALVPDQALAALGARVAEAESAWRDASEAVARAEERGGARGRAMEEARGRALEAEAALEVPRGRWAEVRRTLAELPQEVADGRALEAARACLEGARRDMASLEAEEAALLAAEGRAAAARSAADGAAEGLRVVEAARLEAERGEREWGEVGRAVERETGPESSSAVEGVEALLALEAPERELGRVAGAAPPPGARVRPAALAHADLASSLGRWRQREAEARDAREEAARALAAAREREADRAAAHRERFREHTEAGAGLEAALASGGMDRATLSRRLALGAVWCEAERAALSAFHDRLQQAQAVLGDRRAALARHDASEAPGLPATEAETALVATVAALDQAEGRWRELELRLRQDDQARGRRAEAALRVRAREEAAALWARMDALVGSHDGSRFRGFAQGLTMERLVAHANRHLEELARRYRLSRVPGHALDLQVIDRAMGDEVRGVHSLSGGEGFLVSLALALGLSSLASADTPVESLFIDEGFGTLDAEALETALAALDALQAGGRQVGIISHVEGLAEKVGVQVRVVRTGPGTSRVEVGAGPR